MFGVRNVSLSYVFEFRDHREGKTIYKITNKKTHFLEMILRSVPIYRRNGQRLERAAGFRVLWDISPDKCTCFSFLIYKLYCHFSFLSIGNHGFLLPAEQIVPNCEEFLDGLKALVNEARSLKYF